MKEKQIDEMAKDLCRTDTCEIKKIGIPCYHRCKAHIYATRAVDKGYRKASEVAREIFEEINELKKQYARGDIDGNTLYVYLYAIEKKYTEGGK